MNQQARLYSTPLWVHSQQVQAIARFLNEGLFQRVYDQLSGDAQSLKELPDLFSQNAEGHVSFWRRDVNAPVPDAAIAQLASGQLEIATKGALLLAFSTHSGGPNAALLITETGTFQRFGANAEMVIPNNPTFIRDRSAQLHGHYAEAHMLGNCNCGG